MRGLSILVLFAAACSELLPGSDLCPPGAGPSPAVEHAQAIAGGENHPVAIAVAGGSIFWVDQGPPGQDVSEGSVLSLSLCAGTQRFLARGQNRPAAIAVAGDTVYWVNEGRTNGAGEVFRISIDGPEGSATQIASSESRPSGVAVDGDQVYWTNLGQLDASGVAVPGTGAVRRFDPTSGVIASLAEAQDAPTSIAVRDGVVLWTNAGRGALVDIDPNDGKTELTATFAQNSGAVYRIDPTSGLARVAGDQDAPVSVARDGDRIYWLNRGLFRASGTLARSDGPLVASGLDFPGGMAVDGASVYVAVTGAMDEHEEGHVNRESLDGQSVEIASSQQLPRAIAVDEHLVYWVNFGDLATTNGQVMVRFK